MYVSPYSVISGSLISVKVILRSLFFEKIFSGLTFSPPPPPYVMCAGIQTSTLHVKTYKHDRQLSAKSFIQIKALFMANGISYISYIMA